MKWLDKEDNVKEGVASMKLAIFQIFCRVVEEGSITQAAKTAYMSQPTVTKQIHNLENYYNIKLFDRINGKIKLTKVGEIFYQHAKEILAVERHAIESMQREQQKSSETLYIGASPTIADYMLPSIIQKFKQQYTSVNFNVMMSNTPSIIDALEHHVIDIGLVESDISKTHVEKKSFFSDKLTLVVPNTHPWKYRQEIKLEDMVGEKMLWRESESGTRLLIESILSEKNILHTMGDTIEFSSVQAIKNAVESGLGISILSELSIQKELEYNTLHQVAIQDIHMIRDFWIVQKKRYFQKEVAVQFEHFLMKNIK